MDDSKPIGVFDSGVGGLSTLAALERELPHERFLYFGDTAFAPYGTKPREEVLARARFITDTLVERGCKAVVIACNTATAVAAQELREEKPDLPIVAMEPALKPAALSRHGGRILVLATPMTLRLEKFRHLMEQWGEGAVPLPCPGLMELVEAMDWLAARAYLAEAFAREGDAHLDAVVLGCTHYVFLRPIARELLPSETLVTDGNEGTARQLRRVLDAHGLLAASGTGGTRLCTSGDKEKALPVMERLLAFAREHL